MPSGERRRRCRRQHVLRQRLGDLRQRSPGGQAGDDNVGVLYFACRWLDEVDAEQLVGLDVERVELKVHEQLLDEPSVS